MLSKKAQAIFDEFNKKLGNTVPVQLIEEDGDLYAKGVIEFAAPLRIGDTDILDIRDEGELLLLVAQFLRQFTGYANHIAAQLDQAFAQRIAAATKAARGPEILTPGNQPVIVPNIQFPGGK